MQRTREHRIKLNERLQTKRVERHYAVQQMCGFGTKRAKQLDRKLEPLWIGPAVLKEHLSQAMWRVRMPSGRIALTHMDGVQPYVE